MMRKMEENRSRQIVGFTWEVLLFPNATKMLTSEKADEQRHKKTEVGCSYKKCLMCGRGLGFSQNSHF